VTEFVCEVDEDYRSACKGLEFYGEHEGNRYCVLHFPGEEKKDGFRKVLESKLAQKDYNFGGAIFPEGTSEFEGAEFDAYARFTRVTFLGEANFTRAKFSGKTSFTEAQFSGGTDFSEAQFNGERTYFGEAQFSGQTSFTEAKFSGETSFIEAKFSGEWTDFLVTQFSGEWTDFAEAQFNGERTDFREAQFNGAETSFREVTFISDVYFTGTTFREKVGFWGSKENPAFGPEAWARFDRCRIEKPEQLTFNTVLLHPGWFINTDVRKVDFTDVKWYGMPGGPEGTLDKEIGALTKRNIESPYTLLSQACQRLAANAEENRDFRLANDFYYWSMDALRKAGWRRLGLIRTIYWALSGYGVRAARAFLVLLVMCAAFAVLYMLLGPDPLQVSSASNVGQALEHGGQAVVYSLSTTARLNPEPKPDPGLFQFLVTIEGILGPLQLALLALAIRRKVMR
jgi:uncharacterized protein YjbI with pentapeptide repeats